MGRYREKRKPTVRRQKNMMRLRTIQSEGSVVHFEHNLSMTGPHVVKGANGGLTAMSKKMKDSSSSSQSRTKGSEGRITERGDKNNQKLKCSLACNVKITRKIIRSI